MIFDIAVGTSIGFTIATLFFAVVRVTARFVFYKRARGKAEGELLKLERQWAAKQKAKTP